MVSLPGLGAGRYIAAILIPYGLGVTGVNWLLLPTLRLSVSLPVFLVGGVLAAVGAAVIGAAYWQLWVATRQDRLCRNGLFSIVRHPMYAGWIWLLLPGVTLLLGLPLVLSVSLVMAVVTLYFLPAEEQSLIRQFGTEYKQYQTEVNALVPTLPL